jgi:hypothetical protein
MASAEGKRTERFSEKSLNLENSLNSERSARVQRQGSITLTPVTPTTDIDTTTPALAKLGKMVIEQLQNSRCLGSRLPVECRREKELNDLQRNPLDIEILSNLRFGSLESRDTSVSRLSVAGKLALLGNTGKILN